MNVQLTMENVQIIVLTQMDLTIVDVLMDLSLNWMAEPAKVKYLTDISSRFILFSYRLRPCINYEFCNCP